MSIHACMPVLELLAISVVQLKQMPFCPPPLLLLPKMASHIFFFFLNVVMCSLLITLTNGRQCLLSPTTKQSASVMKCLSLGSL